MSIDSATEFVERMKTDEDFRKEVGEKSSPEERMKFVKQSGFDFTKEELKTAREKLQLTDEELDTITGAYSECICLLAGESDWNW
ncbi:MAG: Nif11-like leader peptide family natural product precursor [bacterium]|nr:Nif11-like leader peptide family natural product precursor [bacterium]